MNIQKKQILANQISENALKLIKLLSIFLKLKSLKIQKQYQNSNN